VPDLVGWRRARMPVVPRTAACELSPDWVCEVLCPSTATRDRCTKMAAYHEQNVEWVWLMDPDARTVEAYRAHPEGWMRAAAAGGNGLARLPPFDAVELDLEPWWDLGDEPAASP